MDDPDKVLEDELGELGGLGARWSARRMSNDAFAASMELELPTAQALAELGEVAHRLGRVIGEDAPRTDMMLRVIIGAGFWDLNPAVVDVQVEPLGPQRCRVLIIGTAKEGIIKQRAGEGAVRRFVGATRFGAPTPRDIDER